MNIDGRVMKDSVVKMFNVCLVGLERKVVAAFLLGVDSLRGLMKEATVMLVRVVKGTCNVKYMYSAVAYNYSLLCSIGN